MWDRGWKTYWTTITYFFTKTNTGTIRIPDLSGIQLVESSLVCECIILYKAGGFTGLFAGQLLNLPNGAFYILHMEKRGGNGLFGVTPEH